MDHALAAAGLAEPKVTALRLGDKTTRLRWSLIRTHAVCFGGNLSLGVRMKVVGGRGHSYGS